MSWRETVRRVIREVDESLPATATLKERRAALRKAAGQFYAPGTSWPSQVWQDERKKYLSHYDGSAPDLLVEAMERGDITFPFRKEGNE